MNSSKASLGLVVAGFLLVVSLAGCSDDAKPSGAKSSADSGKKTSATKAGDSASGVAEKAVESKAKSGSEQLPVPPIEPKEPVKTDPKPQAKTDVQPDAKPAVKPEVNSAAKPEPKPPEGKVEVKAEPDPEPKASTKPMASLEPMPEISETATPTSTSASDDGAELKISTFASAADLAAEVNFLIVDLDKAVATEEEFKSQVEGRFIRDGNTLALLAVALGIHDQDNPLKSHAKAIAAAAQKLAHTKDFSTTKQTDEDLKACFAATTQAITDLKAALDGSNVGDELKWSKVAKLNGLMKDQVPAINNNLKKSLRRFKKRAEEASANAATMALIAENAKLYVADTKKPANGEEWTEFAAQMRAAAVELAAKSHAGDETGAKAAMDKLDQSCHACHKVFNPEKKAAVNPAGN